MFTHQGELKVERKSKYYVFKVSNFRDYFTNLRQMHSSAVIYDIPDKKTGKSKKTCHRSWYKLNEDRRTSRVRLINAIQHAIREYQIAEENRKLINEFGLNHNLMFANPYQIQCERDRRKKMQLDAS